MALYKIINPAIPIKVPSKAADKNSALPCPYGWSLSRGLAATYRLYKPIKPAATFTMLSSASVKIATERVEYQAINFTASNITDITATSF